MDDQTKAAIMTLGERVDHITIVVAELIEACALYEAAFLKMQPLGHGPVEELVEAHAKRLAAAERLDVSTGGGLRLKRI